MRPWSLVLLLLAAPAAAAAAAAAPAQAPAAAPAPAFKVIVHPAAKITSIAKDELSRVFLKKATELKDGTAAKPVDQSSGSAVRAAFSNEVHGRSVASVKSYWQTLIFSGRAVPPREEPGDDAVVKYVAATPGSIGYVSAAAKETGVKVLPVAP